MNSELGKDELVFDVVWERIRKVTGWKNYGQLADFLGIKAASVSGAKKRGYISLDWVFKVAQGYKENTDWLATGEESPIQLFSPEEVAEARKHRDSVRAAKKFSSTGDLGSDFVLVPRYEVSASAGGGALVHSEQIVDHLAFRSEWVRSALDVSVKDLALISVKGDSMEPTLSNGDLILVDTSTRKVEDNAIYVLRYNGALMVKRIQRKIDGSLIIKSDNLVYEPEMVSGEAVNELHVVGRVVWSGRRM
ncbi:helix-turn-helix transcriptional regulator [bacterium]|nr:helix-turn-helix transcriptional regulator [bacterium]